MTPEELANVLKYARLNALAEFACRLKQRARENKVFALNDSISSQDIDEVLAEIVGENSQKGSR